MNTRTTRNILIIFPAGIGDGILALPAILGLRQQFPGAHLELWGYPERWEWLPPYPWLSIRSVDALPLHLLFTPHPQLPRDFSQRLLRFELIISWFGDEQFRENLHRLTRAHIIHQPFAPQHLTTHASHFFVQSLREGNISLPFPEPSFQIHFSEEENENLKSHPPALTIHPGSGGKSKCWPLHHFLKVAQEAQHRWKINIQWLLGPAEEDILPALRQQLPASSHQIFTSRSLKEVARAIRQSQAYLGNDSGISHLAGVSGVSTMVIFTATDPHIWKPLGSRVQVFDGRNHPVQPEHILSSLQSVFQRISPPS